MVMTMMGIKEEESDHDYLVGGFKSVKIKNI